MPEAKAPLKNAASTAKEKKTTLKSRADAPRIKSKPGLEKGAAPAAKKRALKKAAGDQAAPAARGLRTAGQKPPADQDLANLVVAAALEHKPLEPVLLNLSGLSSVADWFFIASAESSRQVKAIAEKIVRRVRQKGVRPLGLEGLSGESHWALVDLGEVVIHIFNKDARARYDLEGLWGDAPRHGPPNKETNPDS